VKNVTIKLDDATAAWVRVYAATQGRSVSSLVAEMLAEKMRVNDQYELARQRWLARPKQLLSWPDGRLPTREETNDRRKLR